MNKYTNYNEKVTKKMTDNLGLLVPNKSEYVSVVRLTASAIASRMGFDIEQIEDIKVAIAEACTNVIKHGVCDDNDDNYTIDFKLDNEKMTVVITDKGSGFSSDKMKDPDLACPKEGGLGIFIIKSLMDEVDIKSIMGEGTTIKMIKYLGDDL